MLVPVEAMRAEFRPLSLCVWLLFSPLLSSGADGGGRTHTPFRVPDFESSASANSATSATVAGNIKPDQAK
jgi:hypothetical protein